MILERAAAQSLLGSPTSSFAAVHSPAKPCTAPHCPTLPYTGLHSLTQTCTALRSPTQPYTALHSATQLSMCAVWEQACKALHDPTRSYTALHSSTQAYPVLTANFLVKFCGTDFELQLKLATLPSSSAASLS